MSCPGLVATSNLAALASAGVAQATLAPSPRRPTPLRLSAVHWTERVARSSSVDGHTLKGAVLVERELVFDGNLA